MSRNFADELKEWRKEVKPGKGGSTTPAFTSPLTTEGDIFYRHSGADARLPVGTNGQQLTSNGTDPVWSDPAAGTNAALFVRQTVIYTTASLGSGASETGVVTMGKSWTLTKISTTRAARVRLYASTTQRDADLSRAQGSTPTGDHGLQYEFIGSASLLGMNTAPGADGSVDGATTSVPLSITNLDTAAGTVGVTFTFLRTE